MKKSRASLEHFWDLKARGPQRPNFMYEISKSPDFRNGFPDFWYDFLYFLISN